MFTATDSYNYDNDPDCWWTATGCVTSKAKDVPSDVAKIPEVGSFSCVSRTTTNCLALQPMSIGYGFDDGPNCSHNAFYDYLEEKNQKASEWPRFSIGSCR